MLPSTIASGLLSPKPTEIYIIDFDSTFIEVEALDILADISLANHSAKAERLATISAITNKAMAGTLDFRSSLVQRVPLLEATKDSIAATIEALKEMVSVSVIRNADFFKTYAHQILIVSGGFKEIIDEVVAPFGIPSANVHANTFTFDASGHVTGFDTQNLLSQPQGKVSLLKHLNIKANLIVIGDGYTDYEIKEAGLAATFFAFTENITRSNVTALADHIAPTFDEILFVNKLPMSLSYPKNRINVLILENIHTNAQKLFISEGYNIKVLSGALDEDELCQEIAQTSILCIRSKTHVTTKVLDHASRLIAVGAFCIGTNQIDLQTCLQKGIAVFNAPYSNTRSVVELAIGEMIVLIRNVVEKSNQMHNGKWNKSSGNSFEIRGKKLGIVGYGNIGTQLSVIAEALGLHVYFYDLVDKLALGNATKCNTLADLLAVADVVTLHVDGRKENANLIGEAQFRQMKNGVIILNLSRGHIVDLQALVANIKSGKVIGAGIDVYPNEPKNNHEEFISELRGLPNVLLTPHIGGSTEEAQLNIATFVPEKIIDYVNSGNTYLSVNMPNLQLPEFRNTHRLIHVHENVSGILAKINMVLADHNVNILGQYLKTNDTIGYVITDIDKQYDDAIISALKNIPNTIKFRVLY